MKVEFRAKSKVSPTGREYLPVPVISRSHCDMNSFRGSKRFGGIANSDLFIPAINRVVRGMCPLKCLFLDDPGEGVSVKFEGFLYKATLLIPEQSSTR